MSALDIECKPFKKDPPKGGQPQVTEGWAATEEVLDSFQLLLIATYPAIVRLGSGTDLILQCPVIKSLTNSQPVLKLSIAGQLLLTKRQRKETYRRNIRTFHKNFPNLKMEKKRCQKKNSKQFHHLLLFST